ncbi:hypothetical protein FRB97_004718, partial [Tulasnella sp. 331]
KGGEVATFEGHSHFVTSVAFSPNGDHLASGSDDKTVQVWDIQRGGEVATFKGHSDWVTSVAFSPNGDHLASGSHDKTVRVWDIQNGGGVATFKGHSHWVTSVAFSPKGDCLASGSDDKTVRVWDIQNGGEVATFKGHSRWIASVAFSPDSRHILARLASGAQLECDLTTPTPSEAERTTHADASHVNARYSVRWQPPWVMCLDHHLCYLAVDVSRWAVNGSQIALGTTFGEVLVFECAAAIHYLQTTEISTKFFYFNGTSVYIEEPTSPDIKKAYEDGRVVTFDPSRALSVVYRKERTLRMSPLGSLVIVATAWTAETVQHVPLCTLTTMEEASSTIASQDDSSSFDTELFFHALLAEAEMPAGAAIAALIDVVCDPMGVSSDSLTPSPLSTPPVFMAWNDFTADDSSNSSSDDLPSLSPPPVFASFFDTECDEEDEVDSKDYVYDNTLLWSLPLGEETEPNDNRADISCVLSLSPPPKFEEVMSENAVDEDEGSSVDASGSCDLDWETAALDRHHSFKSSQGGFRQGEAKMKK